MKKKLYALSGVFMIVLAIAGIWATKAGSFTGAQQTIASSPATTSTAAGPSLEAMTRGSSAILTGTCTGTKSQWVGRSLFTVATVKVLEDIKGVAAGEVTVATPGGTGKIGKFALAQTVPGAPHIYPTERVFLFLSDKSPVAGSYSVMDFAKGKLSIAEGSDGGDVVVSDMTMAPLQKGAGMARGNRQVPSLSEFKARVMGYLK